jgi:molecular chaperone DnaK (HSP70)
VHTFLFLLFLADIADLRVLTLIEENTAAALYYSMDRTFNVSNTVVFFNMGASSVQVSVVTFSEYVTKEAGKNKTITTTEVKVYIMIFSKNNHCYYSLSLRSQSHHYFC